MCLMRYNSCGLMCLLSGMQLEYGRRVTHHGVHLAFAVHEVVEAS